MLWARQVPTIPTVFPLQVSGPILKQIAWSYESILLLPSWMFQEDYNTQGSFLPFLFNWVVWMGFVSGTCRIVALWSQSFCGGRECRES